MSDVYYKHDYEYREGKEGEEKASSSSSSSAAAAAAVVREFAASRVSRTYMNNLIEGSARLPSYISPACSPLLVLDVPKAIAAHARAGGGGGGPQGSRDEKARGAKGNKRGKHGHG